MADESVWLGLRRLLFNLTPPRSDGSGGASFDPSAHRATNPVDVQANSGLLRSLQLVTAALTAPSLQVSLATASRVDPDGQ